MPTLDHEAPLDVLRAAPELLPALLREALGVELPAFAAAEIASEDFSQSLPTSFHADLVIQLRGPAPENEVVAGIVVEVQLTRDERKRQTWPLYTAALHARLRGVPTCLVVIAIEASIAAWAATPITSLHPGVSFVPLVVGPAQVPRVARERAQKEPWLAVLSALAHGNEPGGVELAMVAVEAAKQLGMEMATFCYDLVCASLDDAARRSLEDMMEQQKHKYRSEFGRQMYGDGVRHVLLLLVDRRLQGADAAVRARIETCADVDRLERLVVDVGSAADEAAVRRLLDDL
ncbi:MAG: hypothetical protein F9K40_14265 [Kofleriaceae bacterium]|nr:MAG: hypothetical protein F9K40_14265 [Kofleriaceae bacterium]MBZ0233544.1 hypothetical protein [Kofleriaceae bacterium]